MIIKRMNEYLIIFVILLFILIIISTLGGSMSGKVDTYVAKGYASVQNTLGAIIPSTASKYQEAQVSSIQPFDTTVSYSTI
jgi:cell shape-determining protein MreC